MTTNLKSMDEALNSILYQRMGIGRSRLRTLGFTLAFLLLLALLTVVDINVLFHVILQPHVLVIPFFSIVAHLVGVEVTKGYRSLLDSTSEGYKVLLAVLKEEKDLEKATQETMAHTKTPPFEWALYAVILVTIAAIIIIPTVMTHCLGIVVGYDINQAQFWAEVVVAGYWSVAFLPFLSQCSTVVLLLNHVGEVFEERKNISILDYQRTLLEGVSGAIPGSLPDEPNMGFEMSHYGFHRNANLLTSNTRGMLLLVLAFGIEVIVAILLLSNISSPFRSLSMLWLNVMVLVVLLMTIVFVFVAYLETESAIHAVLNESKRNLIAYYDSGLLQQGVRVASSSDDDPASLKNRVETSLMLVDYARKLPTWTFNAKVALTLGSTAAIQLIILMAQLIALV